MIRLTFFKLAVLDKVIKLVVADAKVLDICIAGDKALTEATNAIYNKKGKNKISKGKFMTSKHQQHSSSSSSGWVSPSFLKIFWANKIHLGIGFPTTISVNNCVAHFSPLPSDPEAALTLKDGDVVKM